jgi:hypothetical protein
MTMRSATLLFVMPGLGVSAPAYAQDSAGWPLPRNQTAGVPSSAPTLYDCRKKTCIYLVNVSNHNVTQFRYATALDKNGAPAWSGNAFPSNYAFYSKRWTAWYPPKEAGCKVALKVVMTINGKDHEESASFDICANPTLLFYIRDPTERRGAVMVDPIP